MYYPAMSLSGENLFIATPAALLRLRCDGSDRTTLLETENSVFGPGVGIANSKIYWIDQGAIWLMPVSGGAPQKLKDKVSGLVSLVATNNSVFWSHLEGVVEYDAVTEKTYEFPNGDSSKLSVTRGIVTWLQLKSIGSRARAIIYTEAGSHQATVVDLTKTLKDLKTETTLLSTGSDGMNSLFASTYGGESGLFEINKTKGTSVFSLWSTYAPRELISDERNIYFIRGYQLTRRAR